MLDRVDRLETSRDASERTSLEGQRAILTRLDALESQREEVPAAPGP